MSGGRKAGGNIVHDFEAHKTTLVVESIARSKLETRLAGTGGIRESVALSLVKRSLLRGGVSAYGSICVFGEPRGVSEILDFEQDTVPARHLLRH